MDEGVHGVDELGRVVRAGSELAEDFPGFELGIRSLVGPVQPGVRCVDGFLIRREPWPVVVVVIAWPTEWRDLDVRARAAIGAVSEHGDPGCFERVDTAVLACRAHVVAGTGQRG